jgi:hypothetical protein
VVVKVFSIELYYLDILHLGYVFFIFSTIDFINYYGALIFAIDIIIFFGVIFCWNYNSFSLVNGFSLIWADTLPNPWFPKAVFLTSSKFSSEFELHEIPYLTKKNTSKIFLSCKTKSSNKSIIRF